MKELRYTQLKLASGLFVPVGIATVVTLKVERDGILGSTLTGFYGVKVSNNYFVTLVTEGFDRQEIDSVFAKRVLSNQGVFLKNVNRAWVYVE